MQRIGVLRIRVRVERRQRHLGGFVEGLLRHLGPVGQPPHVVRGAQTGAAAEHQQIRKGIAAQPVAAVHAAGALTRGEQSGRGGSTGVGVDLDATHDVVTGRTDLHLVFCFVFFFSTTASSMNWWYIDGSRR